MKKRQHDLPPGLYVEPNGNYQYRAPTGDRRKIQLGKISREDALREWVRYKGLEDPVEKLLDAPVDGTVAQIVALYRETGMKRLAEETRSGYEAKLDLIDRLWGARVFARTETEAVRGGLFRRMDVASYLRNAENVGRGAIAANRTVAVLSRVFSHAIDAGLGEYNPCDGLRRNREQPVRTLITEAQIDDAIVKAREKALKTHGPLLSLMIRFAKLTGLRQTDVRLLKWANVGTDYVVTKSSKTGVAQEFVITPALYDVLTDAQSQLPGVNETYVFPMRNGKPMSKWAINSAWQRLQVDFPFRAIRKWAINQTKAAGGNATDFAGHMDQRTTERHYLVAPKRVRPTK